jgi:putative FmdB family regulatory protein
VPMYRYKCSKCDMEFEAFRHIDKRNEVACEKCGGPVEMIVSANVTIFKPFWHEHIDTKPIYIESKKQLFAECEKRNLISHY